MFEDIVRKYRNELMYFCMAQMHRDTAEAEDVVQEVFLTLYKKKNINLDDNIRAWLYETARRKIKEYLRKNPDFEDLTTVEEKTDQFQLMNETDSPLDILSEEERKLLESYYMKEDKNDIATNNNTSLNALYCKIKRIRKKLLSKLDETNNKRKM